LCDLDEEFCGRSSEGEDSLREVMILAQMDLQGNKLEQIQDHHMQFVIAILRKFQWLGAGGSPVTMVRSVLMLRMEETASRYEG
jgi:hypothetical protein